ncbi:ShKT domain-containing protein [Aphelenchoides bicaudatus]|nr:ShKT domain-containing protein [Aphelenchoides bicaudatus]
MFGAPSLNLTSVSWNGDDTRIIQGFLTLKPNSIPPRNCYFEYWKRGLEHDRIGSHQQPCCYFQYFLHASASCTQQRLPATWGLRHVGFRRSGQLLEMTVAKLFSQNRITQFKKMFRKIRNYPY